MLYLRCPTCKNILGNKQLIFESEMEKINEDTILSTDEKNKKREDFFVKLGLDKYCCRMRLISYTKLIDIVK